MITLDAAEVATVQNRHPLVFRKQRWRRFTPLFWAIAVVLYFVYVWSFFNMNDVLERAKWDIAGSYLADWISYESRPDIDIHDNYLGVTFPRFDPLGNDPHPDWLIVQSATVTRAVEAAPVQVTSGGATANTGFMGALPGSGAAATAPTAASSPGLAERSGAAAPDAKPADAATVTETAVVKAIIHQGSGTITVSPGLVQVEKDGQIVDFNVGSGKGVTPREPLPDWITQKEAHGKVYVWLGFDGRTEIEEDTVKVRYRFFGWENFVFDVNSPFWGKSPGEVMEMIFSADQIKPGKSNLALAFDNIWYNAEWQHGDVWVKLLQTIVMAFMGTLLASLLAFPLAFIAARNITPNRAVNWTMKRLFDFTRSVDMLIWALFFTRASAPVRWQAFRRSFSPKPAHSANSIAESLENIDDKQREGVRSVGARRILVHRFGIIPQVLPIFVSQTLYFWESNTRSATIIGAVGAGGIGLKLWKSMRTNSDWENVFYMVILILIVVFIFDNISGFLRSRLIGHAKN